MIVEYHRPKTLEDALSLLERPTPKTIPLGGGTVLGGPLAAPVAVVDLQSLGLTGVRSQGNALSIGACVTLENLLEVDGLPQGLAAVIRKEATFNLRQVATLAGTLVAANGRSPLTTAYLALDATLVVMHGEEQISLGDLLPIRKDALVGKLITQASIPLNMKLVFESVARSPEDRPLVCLALARWPSGRTRVALGGYGPAPILAYDGPGDDGVVEAVSDAYFDAGDEWASAAYRRETAGKLGARALRSIT